MWLWTFKVHWRYFWLIGEYFLAKMTRKSQFSHFQVHFMKCTTSTLTVFRETYYYTNHWLWALKAHCGMKTDRVMEKIVFRAILTLFWALGEWFLAKMTDKSRFFWPRLSFMKCCTRQTIGCGLWKHSVGWKLSKLWEKQHFYYFEENRLQKWKR